MLLSVFLLCCTAVSVTATHAAHAAAHHHHHHRVVLGGSNTPFDTPYDTDSFVGSKDKFDSVRKNAFAHASVVCLLFSAHTSPTSAARVAPSGYAFIGSWY